MASLPKVNGKVVVAGQASVGKSALLERFVNNVYHEQYQPTLGCECLQKSVYVEDTQAILHLYDTAGQERFAPLVSCYYRIGQVCLLCFDLANLASFDAAKWWWKKVLEHNQSVKFVLVGTKDDAVAGDGPGLVDIEHWAEQQSMAFVRTSAREGQGIEGLFQLVADECVRLSATRGPESGLPLGPHAGGMPELRRGCASSC